MKPLLISISVLMIISSCTGNREPLSLQTGDDSTTIYAGNRPLVSYVHSETPAPEGQNPLYRRSAYIHPLRSPGGEVLTRIQPPDHLHHYGIWNPWTRTHFGTDTVDFWNLADGQGTVRFKEYTESHQQASGAGFTAAQEHIWFKGDGSEGVAMNELFEVEVHDSREKSYLVDLSSTLSTPLESGITLEAYRYGGGIGFRATEKWHTSNSTVLTSEGKTRADADGTQARWAIIEGETSVPEGRSGILFLSHPQNQAHPEPMRVWPADQYDGQSNVFFEFCPIRHREWVLEPGQSYTLRYRLVVFDGTMDAETAEMYWKEWSVE
ncbi:MAG: PmoA family protein [Bacteroidota bacterium]